MSALLDLMRAYPDLLQLSGVIGSVIYVGGFALVQSGRTCGNGAVYSASKVIAALLVLISLVGAFNLGAFLIQIGFITFGVIGLFRQGQTKSAIHEDPTASSDVVLLRRPIGYAPRAPVPQDDWQAICDWERRPPGPVGDTPVRLCPAGIAPAP